MAKKYQLDETERKLLEKGVIDISGEIRPDTAYYVRRCMFLLTTMDHPDIVVTITSERGHTEAALGIYDMLRLYEGHVTGRVIGYAGSMAPIVLQSCDKRECQKHARLMVHSIGKRFDADDLEDKKRREKKRSVNYKVPKAGR